MPHYQTPIAGGFLGFNRSNKRAAHTEEMGFRSKVCGNTQTRNQLASTIPRPAEDLLPENLLVQRLACRF